MVYNHKKVESKWQKRWEEEGIYKTSSSKNKKRYVLDMFPYPSGASMHVGHLEGYVGTDILSRYLRMKGFDILHPMGWDAFGLPAENYAIKTGIHPNKEIHKNIEKFKKQLIASGLSYDWDKEIDTSSPEFYKWTQWIFIKLFEKGLAYKKKSAVNWCPKDETVLANEQVIDGKCERCDTAVVKKDLDQWFFKITDYADRLISGLDGIDWLEEVKTQQKNWIGRKVSKKGVTYHIHDWLISRQRYWGCPIPMIYCKDCKWNPVPEKDLPILLPTDVDFLPHGESPIARSSTFQKDVVCPSCGKAARREVDTMDTYVDSSWYFLRFCDPKNKKEFASKKKIIPVDDYVGGGHVVQHLLFARFFWKVLFDLGYIDKKWGDEPFLKLRAPGWILGPDSRKMSKRWGNVVTPDDIIPKFGADTLRVYEMFMGPFDIMKPWSITGVEGAHRFLGRVWRLFNNAGSLPRGGQQDSSGVGAVVSKMHKTIKKVGEDIENYKFNTAISSIMELVNVISDANASSSLLRVPSETSRSAAGNRLEIMTNLCRLLAPLAPHMMEEVWQTVLGHKESIHLSKWPVYNEKYLQIEQVVIVLQVNGKLRSSITLDAKIAGNKEKVLKLAKQDGKVAKWLKSGTIKKEIFIPSKLVNFVV
ncbi:MAG: class I tRNA ligase family protein [Candidatus Woesebacteria bacterium]|nr:class I tRNA ligase family protein [Candidatus Woesebacteria bacterium]